MFANDRATGLRAYSNQSGNSFDRVRTSDGGYFATATVGYGDFVSVQVALAPQIGTKTTEKVPGFVDPDKDGKYEVGMVDQEVTSDFYYRGDFVASALVTPLSGLAVSVDYALNGDDGKDSTSFDDGIFGAAVDVNIGEMLGLGFNVGVSASERYAFEDGVNDVAVTVYGGVDLVDVAVEYAYTNTNGSDIDDYEHYLYAGINLNLVENLLLDVYAGAESLTEIADTFFVGGDVGYTLSGMTFKLGLEYAARNSFNYDNAGFNIVPSVSFSW